MSVRFLGPAALSLALTNCATRPPIGPPPARPPVPPPTEPSATEPTFDRFSPAYDPYRMLLDKGVSPASMDRGCHLLDRSGPVAVTRLKFEGDGRLEPCEVEEFSLDNYERYPDAARAIVGGPIPWIIEDSKILARIDRAVEILGRDLGEMAREKKISRDSDEYLQAKAVALFLFALFPDDLDFIEKNQENVQKAAQAFLGGGLKHFREHLLRSGGLGLALIEDDAPIEATATETLRTKKGWCTEQSKVLFALFRRAKLNPFFNHITALKLDAVFRPLGGTIPPEQIAMSHAYVGVRLHRRSIYFDPTLKRALVEYPDPDPLHLIHYLSGDLLNRAGNLHKQGRTDEGIRDALAAVHLDPLDGMSLTGLARSLAVQDKKMEAEMYRKAIRLGPAGVAYGNLAFLLLEQGEIGQAEEVIDEGLRLLPRYSDLHVLKGMVFFKRQQMEAAASAFEKALALNELDIEAYQGLGAVRFGQHRLDEALNIIQAGLARYPQDPGLNGLLSEVRAAMGVSSP